MKTPFFFIGFVLVLAFLPPVAVSAADRSTASFDFQHRAVQQQQVTLSGWFTIIWGDGAPGTQATTVTYWLTEDGGQSTQLLLREELVRSLNGVLGLNRKRVVVEGNWTVGGLDGGTTGDILQVTSLRLEPEGVPQVTVAVSGPQPWITIACKFSDVSDAPKSMLYFEGMYDSAYPGLDHYWREVSYNIVNLVGSDAVGWYTLPHPRSYYVPPGGTANLNALFNDCTAAADAVVYFPDFVGINMMFNDTLGPYAWGGTRYTTLDGVSRVWYITWEPPWGYENLTVMAHEMGHGFGLPHSLGHGEVYNNPWDVMGDSWSYCHLSQHPVYGCLGQHTISFHKDISEWIAPSVKYVAVGGSATITLERLALPQAGNYRMIQIPIGGSPTHFYTVEARRLVGYDLKLPGQAVIIHEVDTTRPEPAEIVDPDGDGDTGDASAMWVVGETFSDPANGISVSVESSTSTGLVVTVNSPGYPDLAYGDYSADDDSAGQSSGNGNGDVECGEAIELYVSLHNGGASTATGVSATISTSDPYVSWLHNTSSSYPDILAGGTEINSDDFDLVVDSDAPDGHVIQFDLDISSSEGSWSDSFSVPVVCKGDDYEPDNDWDQANWIYGGSPQTHSIAPAGDEDWVKFSLGAESEVVLETSGTGGDTRMWLYEGSLNEIEFNDNGGPDLFSRIDRLCGRDALPAGLYYVKIDEYNDNDEIPSYQVSMMVGPCGTSSDEKVYLPLILKNR